MENSTLVAHSGGSIVTLAEVEKIQPRAPMGTRHYPVAHRDLVLATRYELAKIGLEPVREQYALAHDAQRLFATWDLVAMPSAQDLIPAAARGQRGLAFGFRHGNDQSLAMEIVCGGRVFVCDNMMFSGDSIILHRKHTKNASLNDEIGRGIVRMLDQYSTFEANLGRLENETLTDERAKALLVDAFMKIRVLAPKYLKDVFGWYFNRRNEAPDCEPRTAYGLLNAFTRTIKDVKSPTVAYAATARIGRFMGLRSDVQDAVIGDVVGIEDAELVEE